MIDYGNTARPLKVEASFRKKEISPDEIRQINGIRVYDLDTLCIMKTNAYAGRDKLRDLYDLSFIFNSYSASLAPQTVSLLRSAIEHKGIEQFDYMAREQQDELIDMGKLAGDFLSMFDRLGLLYKEREKQAILSLEQKTGPVRNQRMKDRFAGAATHTLPAPAGTPCGKRGPA
jgi:hypothetical protein